MLLLLLTTCPKGFQGAGDVDTPGPISSDLPSPEGDSLRVILFLKELGKLPFAFPPYLLLAPLLSFLCPSLDQEGLGGTRVEGQVIEVLH